MTNKYQNKYRIPSARAQWWDYGWNGAYFITICTKNREHFFGEVINNKMFLSNTGVIADILWHEITHHNPFAELGDFVVMPNHVHGILILNKPDGDACGHNQADYGNQGIGGGVQTGHALSLSPPHQTPPSSDSRTIGQKRFQNIGKNTISSIIGSYKSAVTKHANRLGNEFAWQTRFHDHIIRNDAEYQRISDYIIANPFKWQEDKFHSCKGLNK